MSMRHLRADKDDGARRGILAAYRPGARFMPSRRDLLRLATLAGTGALLPACGASGYDEAVAATWRHAPAVPSEPLSLQRELVRYATLAANSHNTQPWRFALDGGTIVIQPDLARHAGGRPRRPPPVGEPRLRRREPGARRRSLRPPRRDRVRCADQPDASVPRADGAGALAAPGKGPKRRRPRARAGNAEAACP